MPIGLLPGAEDAGHEVFLFDAAFEEVHPFATPLYYFGMPAPLKAVVDRFYSVNYALTKSRKRAALLVTAADDPEETIAPFRSHYQRILSYLSWEDAGVVAAPGCSSPMNLERTRSPGAGVSARKMLLIVCAGPACLLCGVV